MQNIFQQFAGKIRQQGQRQAPNPGGMMGDYLSQVQGVGDMVAQQQGQPSPEQMAAQGNANMQRGQDQYGNRVYNTGPITPQQVQTNLQARQPMPGKPPALDIVPRTPKQPKESFGGLSKRKMVAPPDFKKTTMASYVTDALKAQIISRILDSN